MSDLTTIIEQFNNLIDEQNGHPFDLEEVVKDHIAEISEVIEAHGGPGVAQEIMKHPNLAETLITMFLYDNQK